MLLLLLQLQLHAHGLVQTALSCLLGQMAARPLRVWPAVLLAAAAGLILLPHAVAPAGAPAAPVLHSVRLAHPSTTNQLLQPPPKPTLMQPPLTAQAEA